MHPEDLLANSLEELRQGASSLEAILTRLPYATRVELEPLLRLALQVERLRTDAQAAPSAAFRDRLRGQLLDATVELAAEPAATRNGHLPHASASALTPAPDALTLHPLPRQRARAELREQSSRRGSAFASRWQQLAAAFAAGIVLFGTAGIGGVQAAKDSLPDSPLLYTIKLAHERVRLTLATTEEERLSVYLQITNTRLHELSRAADAGKADLAYTLSRKYEQSLAETTSAIQNQGPDKTAITRSEVAGVVAQQVSSLQDLVNKAPDSARDAIALALSAARSVAGELPTQVQTTPSVNDAVPAPAPTSTAVVSDPPPPLPTVTVPDNGTNGSAPSSGINVAGVAGDAGTVTREQVSPTTGGFPPPGSKSEPSVTAPSEPTKGLAGSVPEAPPLPPRAADAPSAPPPVPAHSGAQEPSAPAATAAPEPATAPDTATGAQPAPSGDKPPAVSTPPLLAPSATPAPDKSGGLAPAPTPTPGKGLDASSSDSKKGIAPSLRPAPAPVIEVSAQSADGAATQPARDTSLRPRSVELHVAGALVAPDDAVKAP